MKNFLAHFISIALIPLFAPVYLFAIILFYFPQLTPIVDTSEKVIVVLTIFLITVLPPSVCIFILFKMKKISSVTLHSKKDRFIPQIFACLNYFLITFILIRKLGYNSPLTLSMISITISVIIISVINHFWKISAHASGAAGMLAIASVLYLHNHSANFMLPYFALLFSTVAVCFARLQLRVHTISQVVAGCILGSTIGFCCFYFFY